MKALRIIAIVVVAIVAICVLVIALALTPAIQTWALRKAVAKQPGMKLDFAHVAAGLSSANLDNVHLVKDGMVITASHVTAKYSAWDYVSHKRINVDDLTVQDLVIDARAASPAPAPADTTPERTASAPSSRAQEVRAQPRGDREPNPAFNGILNQIQLPFDVRVAHFSVPGKALLPDNRTATFEVHGSDVTTGQRGTIDWTVDVADATRGAAITTLHSTGTANVHVTTERRIDLLDVNAVASVQGPKLPADEFKFEAKAEQPAAGGNEGYNATLSLVHAGNTEPLLNAAGHYDAGTRQIAGAWKLSIRTEQLTALLSGLGLPDIAAQGSGNLTSNPGANTVSVTGELLSDLTRLEKISPALAPVGSLHVQTRFEGGLADNAASVARFTLEATAANGRKLVEVNSLQRIGYSLADKRVTFADAKAELARISVQSLPVAWAQPFAKQLKIDSGDVSMVLAVAAEADGSHVRVSPVEPLTVRNLTVSQGDQKLADQLNLSVKPQADYTQDHVHAELNDLSVTQSSGDTVTGRFTADVTHLSANPTIAFTADTQAKFVALLKPYLKTDTGPLTLSSKSEGTMVGQTLNFATSTTRITRSTGQPVASVDLLQPLTINMQANTVSTPKPEAETLRIVLGEIPLAWAQGFVPNSKFDGQVSGGTVGVAVRSFDDMTASVTQPVTVRGATIALNGQPMLQNVDVTADFTATKHGTTVTYNVRRVDAKQGAASLLNLAVSGDAKLEAKPAVSAKGTFTADLGAVMQQPAMRSKSGLARGSLNATFDARITDTIDAKATVTARNLVAKENNQPLGEAELQLTAAVQPDGSSDLKVPFTLTNGQRKSDLLVDGKLARAGNTVTFNGRITSNQLIIDDLKPLAALAPSSTAPSGTPSARAPAPVRSSPGTSAVSATPTTPTPSHGSSVATAPSSSTTTAGAKDTQPFWSAANGKIDLDLKSITYGKNYVISGVRGTAVLSPTQLAVNADGKLKDSTFKLATRFDFNPSQPQPYTLTGQANIPGFDVGAFLQADNPGEKPMLETTVDINADFNGRGTTLTNTASSAYGTFDLRGGKGVLRALGQSKIGQAANVVSGLGALAGALTGKQEISAGADLVGIFAEIPFDRFLMHAERGQDLNLKVTNLEFVGPEIRITGNGVVQNQPDVPVSKQPMQLTLQLAAKGNVAQVLKQRNLISAQPDEQGYFVMQKSFTIGGSASKADATSLWSILLGAGTNLLQGFFGK